MATQYPNGIDNTSSLPYVTNGVSPMVGDDVNRLRDAIVAVETELGANPSGTFTSVDARLGAAETAISDYANSTFLVLSTDGFISQERVFAPSVNFAIVDGGAGANYEIDLAANVGIGTITPASDYSLTLDGDGATRIGGVTLRNAGTDTFYIGSATASDSANISLMNPNTGYVALGTDGTERVRVTSAGDIGLGTTSPAGRLHVSGGDLLVDTGDVGIGTLTPSELLHVSGGNLLLESTAGSGVPYATLKGTQGGIQLSSSNSIGKLDVLDSTGAVTISLLNDGDNRLVGANSADFSFYTSNTERMRITSGGNVGIGTGAPSSQLSVGASSEFQVDSSGDITRINNVPYTFPSVQGSASNVLKNDGSGNLTWGTIASGGLDEFTRISVSDGTDAAPSYTFTSDQDTGLFLFAPGIIGLTSSGVISMLFAGSVITGQSFPSSFSLRSSGESAALPAYAFAGDTDTGMYRRDSDQIGFSVGGTETAAIDGYGIKLEPGSESFPSYSFISASSDGMYYDSGNIGFSIGGSAVAKVSSGGIKLNSGSASFPSYSFISASSDGMYYDSGLVGISANGIIAATFGENAVVLGEDFGTSDSVTIKGIVDIPTRTRIGPSAADPLEPLVSFAHQSQNDIPPSPLTHLVSSVGDSGREAIRMYSNSQDLEDTDNAVFQIVVGANSTASDLSWDFDVPGDSPDSLTRSAMRLRMTSGGISLEQHDHAAGYPWADGAWNKNILSASLNSVILGVKLNAHNGIGRATAGNLDIGNDSNVANVNIATASSTGAVLIGKPNSNVSIIGMVRLAGSRATKTSSTSRTTNTVSADPDLFITAPSPGTYNFRLVAFFDTDPTPGNGIRFSLGVTAGTMSVDYTQEVINSSFSKSVRSETAVSDTSLVGAQSAGPDGDGAFVLDGSVTITNACDFEFSWANLSTGTGQPAIIKARSYIELIRAV